MSKEKSNFMMFDCLEGGVVKPIFLESGNLTPDRSIILLDEEDRIVYLWHGQRQSLIAKRTALRQAQSLKGHGYSVGSRIVGRSLDTLVEIDAKKVDRVDEDTEMLNMDVVREIAQKEQPKLILAGFSAYPRKLDFKKFREIADETESLLMADIAHSQV